MKRLILVVLIALTTMSKVEGQTYSALWKKAAEAERQDLPRSQYDVLMQIVQKAQQEGEMGQLMRAELEGATVMSAIAPDSLLPAVERIEARGKAAKDEAERAVYQTVVWRICNENPRLEKTVEKTVLTPELCQRLAAVKAADYEPLTKKGADSRWFDDDLLSVIGYEQGDFDALHQYYEQAGNRRAAMITALESLTRQRPAGDYKLSESQYLKQLDSLISVYGDLEEAGEVAIERYNYMAGHTDAEPDVLWQYSSDALSRWGGYKRMNQLRNAQRELSAVQFNISADRYVGIPDCEQKMELVNLRGIEGLTLRFYKVKAKGNASLNPDTKDGWRKLKPLLKAMPELTVKRSYPRHEVYELFEDSLVLPALPVGIYMVEAESTPSTDVARRIYYVSDVRVMSEQLPDKQIRYVAVNATTGQPAKGAKIELSFYERGKYKTQTLPVGDKGEVLFQYPGARPRDVFVWQDDDQACPSTAVYNNFNFYDYRDPDDRAELFTDRSIYRPGQKVHVAAILYKTREGFKHEAIEGRKLTMTLRDANWKVVDEQSVVTDDYGTCAADFTLPSAGLTGLFRVETRFGSCHFRVEEYKRPTFQVEFDKVEQTYADGDTLTVGATARSYAGVPVQEARVKYKVVRRRSWWWTAWSSYWQMGALGRSSDEETLSEGETVTDGEGRFKARMPMLLPKTDYPMFYNFLCIADVTDQAGETHHGELSLPLGNRPTAFSCDLPKKVLAEEMKPLTFHLRNAAGNDVDGQVKYRMDGGKWLNAKTNTPIALSDMKLRSGHHELQAVCGQDTIEQKFTVFSLDDRRPAEETDDWFYASDSQFPRDGKPVTIQVGSSDKDVHIVYSLISGEKVLESGAVDKSNELINRKLTYREEYGTGVLLTFAWIKQGKFYTHNVTITRPVPDTRLNVAWQTFRDRLQPGQQEEWSLVVTKPDGKPADAQLMAVLYDKSLDQLYGHHWGLSPYVSLPLPSASWRSASWGSLHLNGYRSQGALGVSDLTFTHFDENVFPRMWRSNRYRFNMVGSVRARGVAKMAMAADEAAPVMAMVEEATADDMDMAVQKSKVAAKADESEEKEEAALGEPEVQVRENLQETAFFYPQLATDEEGRVVLKFTLPESLTTWRFMGLAHTKDLCNGLLTGETVAKKDVMIQPNVPRFLREDDEAAISARVFNTSEARVTGVARMQLVDPETQQVVYEQRQDVAVEANGTGSVTFQYKPDGSYALLIVKMTVSGEGYSDGEQHYLPILPNRERVTVSVPFTQNEPGTKTIDLTQLVPANSKQGKLTVEYTNNPAWLMIQALPTVGHPADDCCICQSASLYANTIGKYIIDQNPQARNVFEQWKRESGSETSLQSALEKNQELKDLVLDETPWVADADRESEQKQRLADFFDENLMQQRLQSAVDKLGKLQLGDGSWPWWPGMPGSTMLTVSVSETLVRLNKMTGTQPSTARMLERSFKYIGKEMVELVDEMKKQERKGYKQVFPSRMALQWLYICKLDGRQLPDDVKGANDYLVKLLRKETKRQTIYEKAMSAIILDSPTYIKSLKEYTVYKEEMGRYYDTPRAGYSWRDYRIPTQVAAIEAMQLMTPDDRQTIDEMRRWLLQEKRTQAWDTPLNSVDAVYAFLNGNSQELKAQEATTLAIDGKPMELPRATAGLGYVKTAVSPEGKLTFTATKTSEGTSWGAVYAQFLQPTSEVKDSQSGISVKRELLVTDSHSPLTTHDSPLKVGSRVTVRITIESERDLDFVTVQDKRAACMEPLRQLSGYRNGYYCTPRDNVTNYYFDRLPKGKRVIETEYYIDRPGVYQTGTCTVWCAYAPEFRGTTHSQTLNTEYEK